MNKLFWRMVLPSFLLAAVSALYFIYSGTISVRASAFLNRKTILIGEDLRYALVVIADKDVEVRIDDPEKALAHFVIKDKRSISRTAFRKKRIEYSYLATQYEPGDYVISATIVNYKRHREDVWHRIETAASSVNVKSLLRPETGVIRSIAVGGDLAGQRRDRGGALESGPSRKIRVTIPIHHEIKDIAKPRDVLTYRDLAAMTAAAISGSAMIIFLSIYIQRKLLSRRKRIAVPPHLAATKRLAELKSKDLCKKGTMKEFCSELSAILTDYVKSRFDLGPTEITTQEFLDRIAKIDALTAVQKEYLTKLMITCERIKFGYHEPEEHELDPTLESEIKFIEGMK